MWEHRDRTRGLDLLGDAAVAARRLARPGDLVVVGGRLVRPGWIYVMEESDDAPVRPDLLPPAPSDAGSDEPPRIGRERTMFVTVMGDGSLVRQLAGRADPPGRILLFVFDLDATDAERDIAELRRTGWCTDSARDFQLTGTLTVLARC